MVYIEDMDLMVGLVDAVADAVFATARSPESGEWRLQWCADSAGVLQQWAADELPSCEGRG